MAQFGADFGGSMPEYYDRILGPAQFDPFAAELVRRLPAQPGGDVLEIACGTGLVTRRLRERLEPTVRLQASDLSDAMLSYARSRVPGAIEWRTADAAALPWGDAAYAAVVCAFGIMFVPDKPRAFREMRRVLRPGGTLLFSVWQGIERNAHGRIASAVLERLFPGDPEMRGARAPYEFHDRELIRQLVEGAGFGPPRFDDVRIPIHAPTARHFATGVLMGTPRGLLLQKRGVDLEALIDQYAAALAKEGGVEPLELEANATFIQAEALPA